jgi:hypothetical protein
VYKAETETYNKRQATQHGCLPSLLVDGDKGIEKVYVERKIVCTGQIRARQNIMEGPLSFVLLESPFT